MKQANKAKLQPSKKSEPIKQFYDYEPNTFVSAKKISFSFDRLAFIPKLILLLIQLSTNVKLTKTQLQKFDASSLIYEFKKLEPFIATIL